MRLAPAHSHFFRFSFLFLPFLVTRLVGKNVTLQPVYTKVILRNLPRTIGVPCRSSEKLAERMESGKRKREENRIARQFSARRKKGSDRK